MKLFQSQGSPSWIVFQLLEKCNLRCNMCYEWGDSGSYHDLEKLATLDLELVKKTVRECLPGKPRFEFFGGEPLLYSGIWEVIQLIREGGCHVSFPTNGTLLGKYAEQMIDSEPSRVWVSLDGPKSINDLQRGQGVFQVALEGLQILHQKKLQSRKSCPELGITCVVTPDNYEYVEDFFLRCVDLDMLACVSIELQSFATTRQVSDYEKVLAEYFDVHHSTCAKAYIRDPDFFKDIDVISLARQMQRVARECRNRGIAFYSQPQSISEDNLSNYLSGNWRKMHDWKNRCAVPWVTAEISARGDVSTCHTFYDLTLGNLYEESLLEIWQGERLAQLRSYLRNSLFPVCTACCRYYNCADAQVAGK